MKEFIEKLIGRLEEYKYSHLVEHDSEMLEHCKEKEKYCKGNDCFFCIWDKATEIVNQLAEEYKPCHKPCTDCEEYDLVRNHCPKLCKVIKETVKEMEENHNGWIPCSEKLPDDFMSFEYLTIRKGHTLATITYYCVANHKWYSNRNSTKEIEVIAWQPLPEPFKPKGE